MALTPDAVLIVEDHELNLELMTILLEAEGFCVSHARTAFEAWDRLPALRPAILATDVQLPGMSGLELVERVREDHQFRDIGVVVVTSYAMDSDREAALRAGCSLYLAKPIDTRTFGPTVRALHQRILAACRHAAAT